jgi:hypothetical protein
MWRFSAARKTGIAFKPLIGELLVAVLPAGHRLSARKANAGPRQCDLHLADAGGVGLEKR